MIRLSLSMSALPPAPAPAPPPPPITAKARLASMVSRCLQLLHITQKHHDFSTPSSPRLSRASTDSAILPLSASPTQTTFVDAFPEQSQAQSQKLLLRGPPSVCTVVARVIRYSSMLLHHQVHTPVLFVLILFPLSTALVVFCMSTLPIAMQWPRNLSDLAELGRELQGYTQSGTGSMAHVIGVISITAVWKHAWSIPGSVIWVGPIITAFL